MANEVKSVPAKTEGNEQQSLAERAWTPIWHLRDGIDELFDDLLDMRPFRRRHRSMAQPMRRSASAWMDGMPRMDVVDREKEVRVSADLPGIDESDIDVRVTDGTLTIRGEKKETHEEGEQGSNYYLSERRFGSFERTIAIPEGIDQDKIEAQFRKGVLTVHLPKKPEAQRPSKKIEVKSAD